MAGASLQGRSDRVRQPSSRMKDCAATVPLPHASLAWRIELCCMGLDVETLGVNAYSRVAQVMEFPTPIGLKLHSD
jgi:hypothetical protein